MGKKRLRPDEVAEYLSVSKWTVYRWVEEGKLSGTQAGSGSLRICKDALEDFIRKNTIDVSPKASGQGLGPENPNSA